MRLSDLDDEKLIALTLEKNDDAAAALVDRYTMTVYGAAKKVLSRSDADTIEEVAQKTFIKVFRGLPQFQFGSSFGTWITTIAKNTARDMASLVGSRGRVETEYYKATRLQRFKREAPFELEQWQIDAYKKAVKSFSEADQVIWKMRSEGMEHEDIANALGLSVGNVRIMVMRMKDKLVGMLMKYRTNKSKGISRHRAETIVKMMMAHARGR